MEEYYFAASPLLQTFLPVGTSSHCGLVPTSLMMYTYDDGTHSKMVFSVFLGRIRWDDFDVNEKFMLMIARGAAFDDIKSERAGYSDEKIGGRDT